MTTCHTIFDFLAARGSKVVVRRSTWVTRVGSPDMPADHGRCTNALPIRGTWPRMKACTVTL